MKDIVDTAVAAGSFTTLATALEAAGLVDTLKGEGPFTVFAPTDEAFAKLPAGALDALVANPEQLKAVLLYHVVEGKVMSTDVVGLSEAKAVSGATIPVDASAGVKVAGATVTQADIETSNGVIHVVDTVMMPPQ
ncbi:MAG: fasciclin domain-containing protein [Myxococcota bacterium]